jgi:hypothetical protein
MLPNHSGSSGSNNWSPANIATALTLYKSILGPAGAALSAGGASATSEDVDMVKELR